MGQVDEIVLEFCNETRGLVVELKTALQGLQSAPKATRDVVMLEVSQKTDRIMGAAKTIALGPSAPEGAVMIGKLSELCKKLGMQAVVQKRPELAPLFNAFFADALDAIDEIADALGKGKECGPLARAMSSSIAKRMEWLSSKVGDEGMAALMKDLGLG